VWFRPFMVIYGWLAFLVRWRVASFESRPFNALFGGLLAMILVVGPLQDALFGLVLVSNALVGIVQELRAKRARDRLAVLNAPAAKAIRDGLQRVVPVREIVRDDLLVLGSGDQVVVDGELVR
jgi:cation-transporting P-type ATPase E